MGSNTHELAPSAPPDREGWWYGRYRDDPDNSQCIWFVSAYMGKFAVLGESDDPRYGVAYVPDKFDWCGPVPTAQEWYEAKAEIRATARRDALMEAADFVAGRRDVKGNLAAFAITANHLRKMAEGEPT